MSIRMSRAASAAVMGIIAAIALAGCTGTSAGQAEAGGVADGQVLSAEAPAVGAPEAQVATTDRQSVPTERQIVRTGYVAIRVADVAKAAFGIHGLVAKSNGVISNEQTQASGDSTSSMITAQIPSARLDAFIADVSALGTVDSVTVTADDVTTQVVDLDARIKALQTSIDRMTALLAEAKQMNDLLAIETQLSTRQAELDSLTAQRRYLATQVAMSAVTVAVSPIGTVEPVDAPGFLTGLQNGWAAFVSVVVVGVTALGFLLPFLLIGLVIVVPIAILAMRHARRTRELSRAYADEQVTALDDRAPTSTPT